MAMNPERQLHHGSMADCIGRARSQDDAKRRAHRCIETVQASTRLAAGPALNLFLRASSIHSASLV